MEGVIQMGVHTVMVGIGATLVMDAWLMLLKWLKVPTLNFAMVGRWVGHGVAGKWQHASIALAEPVRWERAIGWSVHYATGVIFAGLLLSITGSEWLHSPEFLPALIFGIVTVAAPFLLMQPAMGSGIAAAKTATPWRNRFKSLGSHAVFGMGLYAAAFLLSTYF